LTTPSLPGLLDRIGDHIADLVIAGGNRRHARGIRARLVSLAARLITVGQRLIAVGQRLFTVSERLPVTELPRSAGAAVMQSLDRPVRGLLGTII
jgi:hypothetical protein